MTSAVLHALRSSSPQRVYWVGYVPLYLPCYSAVLRRVNSIVLSMQSLFLENNHTASAVAGIDSSVHAVTDRVMVPLSWLPFISSIYTILAVFQSPYQ